VGTDEQFARFCRNVLGQPELAEDVRFKTNWERKRHRQQIDGIIGDIFVQDTREHWLELLRKAGISAGLVRGVLEALSSPEVAAREMVVEVEHPTAGTVPMVKSPLRFSVSELGKVQPPPLLGQHTDTVLKNYLGFDDAHIENLRSSGAIG
jgi:crotonobetainyl-CoA:carnitine CoA-transferase CaiB-like acyl-CoA transferase